MLKSIVVGMLALSVAACGSTPKTTSERISDEQSAMATLSKMEVRDPSLRSLLDVSYAYVVFPKVGKAGAIVGGAFGRGVLFERDPASGGHRPTGYVELTQASLGAQLGGETFSELIVLRDPEDVRDIKAGQFDLGAQASAIAIGPDAARASAVRGDANPVFIMPRGGLMADISLVGQHLDYHPFVDPAAG